MFALFAHLNLPLSPETDISFVRSGDRPSFLKLAATEKSLRVVPCHGTQDKTQGHPVRHRPGARLKTYVNPNRKNSQTNRAFAAAENVKISSES
jgi:hypothetical protein